MSFDPTLAEYHARKAKALAMGGEAKLARRRTAHHLNARERLAALLDADSFVESGLFATSIRPEVAEKAPADGKIAGFGRINGRMVAVISNDFTVLGASSSAINGKKMKHIKDVAAKRGMPLIFLGESAGARIPDRMGAAGRAMLGQDAIEYQRLRQSPWISALLGSCYGSSTWYSAMSDFAVMRKGATMAVASSRVTSLAINQPIDPDELGGWKLHTEVTGLVDVAVDSDEEALEVVKRLLSYLPSNSEERPPISAVAAGSDDAAREVLGVLPETRSQVYDMRRVIELIVDKGSVFEFKPRFGKSIVSALARLNGQTIGIIANNPMFKGGSIDVDACRKATSFLVFCDSFNIPIVIFVDQPGFLIGQEGEKNGAPGKIINWLNALSLVTVPKVSIIVRKSYGQAYLNMGGGRNSDEVACWPTADLGFMDPSIGANVMYGVTRESDVERFEVLKTEIARDTSPWALAALYEAQAVIDPRDTREYLKSILSVHDMRMSNGVGQHRLCNWPTSY